MRHCGVIIILLLLLMPLAAVAAQTTTFTRESIEYELELPSAQWRAVQRLDVHDHFEFVYGETESGYLRISKNAVDAATSITDLIHRDRRLKLRQLSGYVECEEGPFGGNLQGRVLAYEYTSGGAQMAGRVYYLRVAERTAYTLHFTGERDKLRLIGDQIDLIARSFRLK